MLPRFCQLLCQFVRECFDSLLRLRQGDPLHRDEYLYTLHTFPLIYLILGDLFCL